MATGIEYIRDFPGRLGELWSPITGCNTGCTYCWARRWAKRFGKDFTPQFHPERLKQPLQWRRPRAVGVCFTGELFGDWVPQEWPIQVYETMAKAAHHTFIILTKWPHVMRDMLDGMIKPLPNVWHLTSVENQDTWDERVPHLLKLREQGWPVLGVSVEPMMGPIVPHGIEKLDWVIVGGMSGSKPFYPPEHWVQDIEEVANNNGVPVFEKSNLRKNTSATVQREFPCQQLRR